MQMCFVYWVCGVGESIERVGQRGGANDSGNRYIKGGTYEKNSNRNLVYSLAGPRNSKKIKLLIYLFIFGENI